jgi:hypothetical protein
MDPLRTDGKEGVEEVVELMEEYGISQEDYDTTLELTKFKARFLSGSNFRVCFDIAINLSLLHAALWQKGMLSNGTDCKTGKPMVR